MKTLDARTLEQWRKWLSDHHDSESEVWLVFHKRHTRRACVDYDEALDEALCFGWIDSLIKRLDDAAVTSAAVYWVDRFREAGGNKEAAIGRGDSPACGRQTAGIEVRCRRICFLAVPVVANLFSMD